MQLLYSIFVPLGVNHSLPFALAIFVGTWFICHFIAFSRVSTAVVERSERTEGRDHLANDLRRELEALRFKIEEEMKQARAEAMKVFGDLKHRAVEQEHDIMTNARHDSIQILKDARRTVEEKFQIELKKIEGEVPQIASQIVEQLSKGHFAMAKDEHGDDRKEFRN